MERKIILKWANLKNEIDYETYKAAEITISQDPVVKGEAQSDNTNADADFCRTKIDAAVGNLEELMHKYITTDLTESTDEITRDKAEWEIDLTFDDNDRRTVNIKALTQKCHKYVVSYVLYEWCKLALPTLVQAYADRMSAEEKDIVAAVNRKEAPELSED